MGENLCRRGYWREWEFHVPPTVPCNNFFSPVSPGGVFAKNFNKNQGSRRYATVLCRPIPAPDDDDVNFTSMSTSIIRPCRHQFYVHVDLNLTSMSTSIIHPCRPQFYVHVDLNYTSMSTSIVRPCRPQLYVHVDLNYTSMSTSILRPCRPQLYIHVDLHFTSMSTSI